MTIASRLDALDSSAKVLGEADGSAKQRARGLRRRWLARRNRPIAITWRLEHPLLAALYQRYATLAPG